MHNVATATIVPAVSHSRRYSPNAVGSRHLVSTTGSRNWTPKSSALATPSDSALCPSRCSEGVPTVLVSPSAGCVAQDGSGLVELCARVSRRVRSCAIYGKCRYIIVIGLGGTLNVERLCFEGFRSFLIT